MITEQTPNQNHHQFQTLEKLDPDASFPAKMPSVFSLEFLSHFEVFSKPGSRFVPFGGIRLEREVTHPEDIIKSTEAEICPFVSEFQVKQSGLFRLCNDLKWFEWGAGFSLVRCSDSVQITQPLCGAAETRAKVQHSLWTLHHGHTRPQDPDPYTVRPPAAAATAHTASSVVTRAILDLVSHQVALSEKLHHLMTEIQDGGSDKNHFLLAN